MLTSAQSTISVLMYDARQSVELRTLAQAIEADLSPDLVGPCTVRWDGDGFVSFELLKMRISLARMDLAGSGRAGLADCLVVAVGPSSGHQSDLVDPEQFHALCTSLAQEIDAIVPAICIFTTNAKTIVTSAFLERVAEKLGAPAALPVRPRRPVPARSSSPARRERISRLGPARPKTRPSRAPLPEPVTLSNVEQEELTELSFLRKSIHEPTEGELLERRIARKMTRRIAIFSIHTGVIILSAPIGAASLTYAALGRESVRAAAHTLAITGILIGLAGAGMAGPILDILI